MDSSSLTKPTPSTQQALRCAVYARTSREGEVDPAFGSITAQQEACFGYIASHHYMSWLPASVSYDDPGITGSTLERPALQRMLADVEAGLVDSSMQSHPQDRIASKSEPSPMAKSENINPRLQEVP